MKILFIGDIVAKPGRAAVKEVLPDLIKEKKVDLVIANIENLAHGKGATEKTVKEIREVGVDIMTSGNHIWFREDFSEILNKDPRILRPANYPADSPGYGFTYAKTAKQKVLIINLIGRQWMNEPIDEPYRTVDAILLDQVEKEKPNAVIVDYHAEATSEKAALGWFLDGRVTAVVGTHTHIPTADPQILPKGAAFITDVGMSGAINSVLGVEPDIIIRRQKDPGPRRFEWVETGPKVFRSILIETKKGGAAKSIERVDKKLG
jgi:metallophosphoesterase (TIGR00282 family)